MFTKIHLYFCAGRCIYLYVHAAFVHSCYQTVQPHVKMSEVLMLRQHFGVERKEKTQKSVKDFCSHIATVDTECDYVTVQLIVGKKKRLRSSVSSVILLLKILVNENSREPLKL